MTTETDSRPPNEQITTTCMLDGFHLDLVTRWLIAIVSVIVATPLFIVGMAVWVAYINNWNFLTWLE